VRRLPETAAGTLERQCTRAEVHVVDQDLHFLVERSAPIVTTTMREAFDLALVRAAEEAGAKIVSGCKLLDLAETEQGVEMFTTRGNFAARFLVGADGALSVVARRAGFQGPGYLVPGLETEVTTPPGLRHSFEGAVRFDFGMIPKGYGWVFPKENHLSVGVGQMRKGGIHLENSLKRYLRYLNLETSRVLVKKGCVIPVMPRHDGFVKGRVLLVGDAAGLVDPITGEGISAAIDSGRIAADVLAKARFRPALVKNLYEGTLRKTILNDLKWGRFVSGLVYDHPAIGAWLFRTCGQQLCEVMTDIIFGTKTYRSVFSNPLSYLKMFFPILH